MQPILIQSPDWLDDVLADWPTAFPDGDDPMRLALALARENVERGSGGPFGAVVLARTGGRLLGVGLNLVVASRCAMAHAEMVALAAAQQSLGCHDLRSVVPGGAVLVSSAEPCAMCLGALAWSGVDLLVCAARDADIRAIGFDEGDKPAGWPDLLAARGISLERDRRRAEAVAILEDYATRGGLVYNPRAAPKPLHADERDAAATSQ